MKANTDFQVFIDRAKNQLDAQLKQQNEHEYVQYLQKTGNRPKQALEMTDNKLQWSAP